MPANELPPYSIDAEMGVVGSLLISPSDTIPLARRILRPEYFRHPSTKLCYETILAAHASGRACDFIILTKMLEETGKLETLGVNEWTGVSFVTHCFTFTPTSANFQQYAETVREDANRLLAWKVCNRITALTLKPTPDTSEAINAALSGLLSDLTATSGAEHKTWAEHINERLDFYERESINQGDPVEVRATGIAKLDAELGGGLVLGDYAVISGPTSSGKSALACQIAEHVATAYDEHVLICSYEMRAKHLVDRAIARAASINSSRLRMGKIDEGEFGRLAKIIGPLTGAKIHVREKIKRWTVEDLAADARSIKAKHGLTLMVVDYLQLVSSRQRGERREREVAETSGALIDLAQELNIVLIGLSQLNKDGGTRESQAIVMDSDVALIIEAGEDDHHKIVRGDKVRHGKRGWAVTLQWTPTLTKFV